LRRRIIEIQKFNSLIIVDNFVIRHVLSADEMSSARKQTQTANDSPATATPTTNTNTNGNGEHSNEDKTSSTAVTVPAAAAAQPSRSEHVVIIEVISSEQQQHIQYIH
jgi:hypothetical protein